MLGHGHGHCRWSAGSGLPPLNPRPDHHPERFLECCSPFRMMTPSRQRCSDSREGGRQRGLTGVSEGPLSPGSCSETSRVPWTAGADKLFHLLENRDTNSRLRNGKPCSVARSPCTSPNERQLWKPPGRPCSPAPVSSWGSSDPWTHHLSHRGSPSVLGWSLKGALSPEKTALAKALSGCAPVCPPSADYFERGRREAQ